MHHDHDADGTCGQAPGVLPGVLLGFVLGLELDLEHFGEVLAQAVRRGALYASACCGDESFDRRREERSRKPLVRRLVPLRTAEGRLPLIPRRGGGRGRKEGRTERVHQVPAP